MAAWLIFQGGAGVCLCVASSFLGVFSGCFLGHLGWMQSKSAEGYSFNYGYVIVGNGVKGQISFNGFDRGLEKKVG